MVDDKIELILTYTIVVLCRILVLYKLYVTHASLNLLLLFVRLSLRRKIVRLTGIYHTPGTNGDF